MPLPRWLARLNLAVTSRIMRPAAGVLPWFGVIEHVGRRSGTVRTTPVNVFRSRGRYLVALTYGPDTEWVKNVVAAGGCRLLSGGRWIRLDEPHRFTDARRTRVPMPVRLALAGLRVDEFLELRRAEDAPA